VDVNRLIWLATIVSIATFQFWSFLPKGAFYIGMAIFILITSLIIFKQNRNLFVAFLLICLAVNNLLDELFFDPKKNGINEIILLLGIPIIYYVRKILRK